MCIACKEYLDGLLKANEFRRNAGEIHKDSDEPIESDAMQKYLAELYAPKK